MAVDLKNVVDCVCEIKDDSSTTKNVKVKIEEVLNILKDSSDEKIRVNKALYALDEIVYDNNIQQHTRTQIWNIVSMLESV